MCETCASAVPVSVVRGMAMVLYGGGYGKYVRIGPERHAYVYAQESAEFLRCSRGSGSAAGNEVLFMYKETDGVWYAVDAPRNSRSLADVKMDAVPVFRTREAALEEGWHTWETNWNVASRARPDWRATGLCCQTSWLT